MDNTSTSIKLLVDITVKKEFALDKILTICHNQKTVLTNNFGLKEERVLFFSELAKEKQFLIDEIQKLDQTFERVYRKISLALREESVKLENRDTLKELQMKITDVSVLDTKIRKLEKSNDLLVEGKREYSSFETNGILKKYDNNKRKEF